MHFGEKGWEFVNSMQLAPDRDQWSGYCEHNTEPSGFIKGGKFLIG